MKNDWCIENDFAAQRELAAMEEALGLRENEMLHIFNCAHMAVEELL